MLKKHANDRKQCDNYVLVQSSCRTYINIIVRVYVSQTFLFSGSGGRYTRITRITNIGTVQQTHY